MKQVTNLGEALTVLVQVAELAQAKGVLSFEDAVITKSAIDFINELSKQASQAEGPETLEEVSTIQETGEVKVKTRGPKAK
jgi:hypothetical protein